MTDSTSAVIDAKRRFRFLTPLDSRRYYVLLGARAMLVLGPLGGITAA